MDVRTLKKALDKSDFLRSHIIICGVGSGNDDNDSDKEGE